MRRKEQPERLTFLRIVVVVVIVVVAAAIVDPTSPETRIVPT